MTRKRVLVTGASGYVAGQMLPTFRERYDLTLVDARAEDRNGEALADVALADLVDDDRTQYAHLFEDIDAVVHTGHIMRSGEPLAGYTIEKQNLEMAHNVLRAAYDAGVPRVVMASSNHAADWYENHLILDRRMEVLDPYTLPLSSNFYGWSKAAQEHLGFLFACGFRGWQNAEGLRPMGVVMVRIGSPRELDARKYEGKPEVFKRVLGSYVSARDLTQLFVKSIETESIDNEHGVPWQVFYGISDNTRAFWSLANAREVVGYEPEDDSEVKYAADIQALLTGEGPGSVGRLSSRKAPNR